MANEEQLEILLSGVEAWNRWRKAHPGIEVNLRGADLQGADLQKADLQSVDLQGARLRYANLQFANLQGANLQHAQLWNTQLEHAQLQNINLYGTDLWHTNLRGASLHGAELWDTLFTSTEDLHQAKGLEEIQHSGPSTVDHRTLENSQGQLPEAFLKGCGFKDWEILNAHFYDPNLMPTEIETLLYDIFSLRTKGPIQVSSLFISYSREDTAFVDFIEKRLDNDGIRSWRDVHHMTAGPVEQQIERAIDLNGTVLLVLSENSLGSAWVEWEVTRAEKRQRELQQQGKDTHVLCPVAIDRTWEQSRWPGPLMNQIKKYNILDFSSWETNGAEASYQKLKSGIAKYYAG